MDGGYKMKRSKNILTDKEMELVSLLMQDCQSTGDIQTKLKRLFAGTNRANAGSRDGRAFGI